jgi:hypothetical protein
MDIHGYPWISMDIHGYPWTMDIHGYPWIPMAPNTLKISAEQLARDSLQPGVDQTCARNDHI